MARPPWLESRNCISPAPAALAKRREITEHVYRRLFARRAPLLQDQDHLVIYRGVPGNGLI